jgi:phosphatidylcholine synthase
VILPWIAHLYTASGLVLALFASIKIVELDFRSAILALFASTIVDATDGVLARGLRVKEKLPDFDGAHLDDIVDYLTYVFVPLLFIWRAGLLPESAVLWVGGAVLVASAYGFVQPGAKVLAGDYFFTGFPSYWNIVALYMYVLRLSSTINAVVLLACAILVFVPIRYVYPSRTKTLRLLTLFLAADWAALLVLIVWRLPATDGPWIALSFVFPVYYLVLSLWLSAFARRNEIELRRDRHVKS